MLNLPNLIAGERHMGRRAFLWASIVAPAAVKSKLGMAAQYPKFGVNLIEDESAPFGSPASYASLQLLSDAGFQSVAIIPFFWQPSAHSPDLVAGSALPDDRLRAGISMARRMGLHVLVKPHVWVPESWAGAIEMKNEDDWNSWFAAYERALLTVATIADEEGAEALSIGTELRGTSHHSTWHDVIGAVRASYGGQLSYVAHGAAETLRVPFWKDLDAVSASFYPILGAPTSPANWRRAMEDELRPTIELANQNSKPFWIGEIGLRSAEGATLRPWESAEERDAYAAPQLQLDVLKEWSLVARQYGVDQAFVWRWISDPDAGGLKDTDFTIQGKPAERLPRLLV